MRTTGTKSAVITSRVFSAVKQSLDKATSAEDVLVVAVSGGADSMCLLDITGSHVLENGTT